MFVFQLNSHFLNEGRCPALPEVLSFLDARGYRAQPLDPRQLDGRDGAVHDA